MLYNVPGVSHVDVDAAPSVPGRSGTRPSSHSLVVAERLVAKRDVVHATVAGGAGLDRE